MSKSLVVYFSRADENYNVGTVEVGNTELLAKEIAKQIGADEFKITPVKPYDPDYQVCVMQATDERNQNARPAYKGEIDIAEYDTIYLGYPIWWGDLPMIVYSFLENHDFAGKTVKPFCTHEGSADGGTFATLKSKLATATVADGLAIAGHTARTEAGLEQVRGWVVS